MLTKALEGEPVTIVDLLGTDDGADILCEYKGIGLDGATKITTAPTLATAAVIARMPVLFRLAEAAALPMNEKIKPLPAV